MHNFEVDVGTDFALADLLSQGKILYRDIAYRYFPLAPWVNAALFRLLGRSTDVLLGAATAASFGIVILVFLLGREILPPAPAMVASLIVLNSAVYGPHLMSYATPYSFACTYGLLFSLIALYGACRTLDTAYSRWDFITGCAAGLGMASKHEFAIINALIVGVNLAFRFSAHGRRILRGVFASAGVCAAVTAVFASALLRQLGPAELREVLYPAGYFQATRYFSDNIHYWGSKFWAGVLESHIGFLLNLGFVVAAVSVAAVLAGLLRREPMDRRLLVVAVLGTPFLWVHRYIGYYPVLLHAVVLAAVLSGRICISPRKIAFFTVCAVIFLLRVLPAPDVSGYPFTHFYFAPSLIVYLYLCYGVIAPALAPGPGARDVRLGMTGVFLGCFVIYSLVCSTYRWSRQMESVVTARGAIWEPPQTAAKARMILDGIGRHSGRADRILVIPHGCMYYFLSGRQPAGSHLYYTPGELLDGAAEEREIRVVAGAAPALVVIDDAYVPQPLFFAGSSNRFGEAYNARFVRWIRKNFAESETINWPGGAVHFLTPTGHPPS